jgi:hypothetical protein
MNKFRHMQTTGTVSFDSGGKQRRGLVHLFVRHRPDVKQQCQASRIQSSGQACLRGNTAATRDMRYQIAADGGCPRTGDQVGAIEAFFHSHGY